MSQFGPNKGKPIDVFNDNIPFGDDATEQFLSQDIDFTNPLQAQRAAQVLNDLNIDIPRNSKGQITSKQALQDRLYTLQAKRAQQMVDLNIMVNKSRVDFANRVQSRYRQVEDGKGNPQFGNLVDDIGKVGNEIIKKNSQSIQDPLTRERYEAMFRNEVKNQQLDAKGQARTQQLQYLRSSYDIQHEGLLSLAKSNSLMDGGLLLKDYSQQLAIGVDQGVLSEDEAVEKEQKFRRDLATEKTTNLKKKFDLNTQQAIQASPGLNPDSVLQSLNPLGDYQEKFLEAGKALNAAHGLDFNKDGTKTNKFSDIKPGGVPRTQLASDGKTKLPRVRTSKPSKNPELDLFTATRISETTTGSINLLNPSKDEILLSAKISAKRTSKINPEDVTSHIKQVVKVYREFKEENPNKPVHISVGDDGHIHFSEGKPTQQDDNVKSTKNNAFYNNLGDAAASGIRSPEQVLEDSVPVTSAPVTSASVTSASVTSASVTSAPATSAPVTSIPVTSSARVAKANEKTKKYSDNTVEGITNSINSATAEVDELVSQGILLPAEGRKLKDELNNKFNTLLKSAAIARTKEAARDITSKDAITKEVGKQITSALDIIKSGVKISPDKLSSLEDSIKGTSLEMEYQQKVNKAKALSVFSGLTSDARQRVIDSTPGSLGQEFYNLNKQLTKKYVDDPVNALAEQEFLQLNPLDFSADNLGEQLEVRGIISEVTEKQTGRVNPGLTNQEVKDFIKAFNQADDIVKSKMLGQITTSLPPRAARELLATFDKEGHGYLAAAGSFYSQGGDGIRIADFIIAGNAALKSSEFKAKSALNSALELPSVVTKSGSPVIGIKAATTLGSIINLFTDEERGSLFPDTRAFKGMEKQIKDRARVIYAGLTAEAGELDDKEISPDRLEEAVTLALGGEPIYIGGKESPVLRPTLSTDGEQVNNMIMGLTRADLGRLGGIKNLDNLIEVGALGEQRAITKLLMEDVEYTAQGPGRYEVYLNGLALQTNEGKPFILDINTLQGTDGKVKPKSKTMQDALAGSQMLSQLQDEKENELANPESGLINDIIAHNNIIQTSDGLKDVSNTAVDDIEAAFEVGTSLDIPGEDIIALYDAQTNETGDTGLPAQEFARLAVKYGKKYGVTEDMVHNDKAQVAMVAELYKELRTKLEDNGIPATVRDVRVAQVLGVQDASKLIKALDADPNTDIRDVFSPTKIAKFPELFSGDVSDVFYKISDLSFEDEAFEEEESNQVGFVFSGEGEVTDTRTGKQKQRDTSTNDIGVFN